MVRATDFRRCAIQRQGGLCGCGCGARLEFDADDHHIFERSHVSRRVRHEFWNRALVNKRCHTAIHDHADQARIRRTERAAVARLLAMLSPVELETLISLIPEGATSEGATVRAYELMRRQQYVLEPAA